RTAASQPTASAEGNGSTRTSQKAPARRYRMSPAARRAAARRMKAYWRKRKAVANGRENGEEGAGIAAPPGDEPPGPRRERKAQRRFLLGGVRGIGPALSSVRGP